MVVLLKVKKINLTNEHVRVIVVNNESYIGHIQEQTDKYVYLLGDNGRHYFLPWSNIIVITVLNKKG